MILYMILTSAVFSIVLDEILSVEIRRNQYHKQCYIRENRKIARGSVNSSSRRHEF